MWGNLQWPGLPSARSGERPHGEARIEAGPWRTEGSRSRFLWPHSGLPLIQWPRTIPVCIISQCRGAGCGCLLGSDSQKAEIKMFSSAFSSAHLPSSSSCWQDSVPCGGTEVPLSQPSPKSFFFFLLIFIGVQLIYNVVLVSGVQQKVTQLYIYMYPLFFRFFSHIGHYRILGRVPCAVQQVLISYLFYI